MRVVVDWGTPVLKFITINSPKLIFVLALLALLLGVFLQEPLKVFDQAIRICLSCIGLV
jgi:hypothetical protein